MKVLVSHGSGCVAGPLAEALRAAGKDVVLLADGGAEVAGVARKDWPKRADALARALDGVSEVYALDLVEASEETAPTIAKRLEKLVAAAAKAEVGHLVLLSRTDVYDPALLADKTARETSPQGEKGALGAAAQTALSVETRVRETEGVPWYILRAPMILGADSSEAKALFRSILIDEAPSPDRFHPVDVMDVVSALVALPSAPRAVNQVFNVAAPAALTGDVMDQELGRLARLLNDEADTEDKLRPDYDLGEPVFATDKLARLVGVSAEKLLWTSLAETMQQLMKELRADGTLEPLPEKIKLVNKAVELGETPMTGKVVVITGVTSGIGRATAKLLSRLGATVVGVARNAESGAALMQELEEGRHTVPGHFVQADLMSFAQIRRLAAELSERFPKIDVLINNAGANFPTRRLTEDGFEATFALNHLAPFLLTNLLAEPLKAAEAGRIVMVSSDWHRMSFPDMTDLQMESGYRSYDAYCRAKFLNLQVSYVMAVLLEGTNVTVNAIHPGVVRTGISSRNAEPENLPPQLQQAANQARERAHQRMISPEAAAVDVATLAVSPAFEGKSGLYVNADEVQASADETYDEEMAWQVWDVTARMTGLIPAEPEAAQA